MLLQAIILGVVALIALGSAFAYYRVNETYYISYNESGNIDYRVGLNPNEFYEEEWQEGGQAYVASLIDSVVADFEYRLIMDASDVKYQYSYSVDAQLEIIDRPSNDPLYHPVYELVPERTLTADSDNVLTVKEQISIDYGKYNNLANLFVSTYDLTDVESTLVVRMNLYVLSECDAFEQNSENSYTMTLRIPLTTKTVDIEMTSSVATEESKVLVCSTAINRNVFKVIGIVAGILSVLLAAFLIAYAYLTRNHDINYSIKVKKLLSNYRSYIQKITNEFDKTGYQLLFVDSFNEMLYIRDTIQSPILMSENQDHTCTQFLIPTNTKILYVFEIRVEDYDEIYGDVPEKIPDMERDFYEDAEHKAVHGHGSHRIGVIRRALAAPLNGGTKKK